MSLAMRLTLVRQVSRVAENLIGDMPRPSEDCMGGSGELGGGKVVVGPAQPSKADTTIAASFPFPSLGCLRLAALGSKMLWRQLKPAGRRILICLCAARLARR